MTTRVNPAHRHPGTAHLLVLLNTDHLPPKLHEISGAVEDLAHELVAKLEDGPELTVGLRHLLDAKDALVRQRVIDLKAAAEVLGSNDPEPELL